jgi:hypothetical protein
LDSLPLRLFWPSHLPRLRSLRVTATAVRGVGSRVRSHRAVRPVLVEVLLVEVPRVPKLLAPLPPPRPVRRKRVACWPSLGSMSP